jgi:uncharacterized phiE125 gp8 family phage protein
MELVVSTPPAIEPLTLDEAKAFCRLDGTNAEPKPPAITAVALAAPAAAGNVDNGAHRYLATFVTAIGETEAGVVSAAVAVADKTVNGKVQLSGIPLGGSAVTSRKIYRTAAGGAVYMLLATLADNTTTTYLDNIADSALGAGAPAVNTTGDPLLAIIIASARQKAETALRRYLITQTVDMYLEGFPGWSENFIETRNLTPDPHRYEIRLPPIQSVTEIAYTDSNAVVQVLDPTLYTVDAVGIPARVVASPGNTWPTALRIPNAVRVRFVAGYGATAASVPACVKLWMAIHVKAGWDNRDMLVVGAGGLVELPSVFVDGLLDPERVHGRLGNE